MKISMKGLAKFMNSSDAQKRKVVRDFKYPKGEGEAQAAYYRDARTSIRSFHENNHPTSWLTQRAASIRISGQAESGKKRERLLNNARALDLYSKHYGTRKFAVLDAFSQKLTYKGVTVHVQADLHIKEKGIEKIIRIGFSKDESDPKISKVLGQLLFEATTKEGLGLKSSQVLLFDLRSGIVVKGARAGSRTINEIEAACENISDIWQRI